MKKLPDLQDFVTPTGKPHMQPKGKIVMVVLQDWASDKWLKQRSKEEWDELNKHGYLKRLKANKNLCRLLCKHLNRDRSEVYVTNAFPFIKKSGAISAPLSTS